VDDLGDGWAGDEVRHGLQVQTLLGPRWAGQRVRERDELVYLSVFAPEQVRTSQSPGAS
jgi:hypothetical protein